MRVVVVGATGNVGTSVLEALAHDDSVSSILGIARRTPQIEFPKTEWAAANIESADVAPLFDGADVVVHLAWRIQPSRDLNALWHTNVEGSSRVFEATVRAGVGKIVYGSSVGVYSPGPKSGRVDEGWDRDGVPSSFYARHKAEVERRLDNIEHGHRELRVVRLRPALVFKRDAAAGIRRLFAGPFLPTRLLRARFTPFIPAVRGLRFQAVHGSDVGDAYRAAVTKDVSGAFNIAAEPVLDAGRSQSWRELALSASPPRLSARPQPWLALASAAESAGMDRSRAAGPAHGYRPCRA